MTVVRKWAQNLKNLTEMALFLSLNCSEDLKQSKNPWDPTGLGYNWLTDTFAGW